MTRRWLVTVTAVLAMAACGDDGSDVTPAAGAPGAGAPGVSAAPPAATAAAGAKPTQAGPGDATRNNAVDTDSAGADARADDVADEPAPVNTDAFVAVVRDRLPKIAADRRDDEIAVVAEQACGGLAAGRDANRIIAEARSMGTLDASATDHATARELVKLAIDTACPGQAARVDEF